MNAVFKNYKSVALSLLTAGVLSTSGCVTQSQFDKEQIKNQGLQFQLDVAERTISKRNRELAEARLRRKTQAGELAQYQNQLASAKSQINTVQASVANKVDNEVQKRLEELRAAMPQAEVSAYGGIVLESGIFFKPGRHQISEAGKAALLPLIAKLAGADFDGYNVEIAGHTDTDPIRRSKTRYTDNHILAANRANSVRRFIVAQGISAERLYLTAWGAERPLFAGAPKAKNRRVEIVLQKKDSPTTTLEAGAKR